MNITWSRKYTSRALSSEESGILQGLGKVSYPTPPQYCLDIIGESATIVYAHVSEYHMYIF